MSIRHNARGYQPEVLPAEYYTPEYTRHNTSTTTHYLDAYHRNGGSLGLEHNYIGQTVYDNAEDEDAAYYDPPLRLLGAGTPQPGALPLDPLFTFTDPATGGMVDVTRADAMPLMLYSTHITAQALETLGADFDAGDAQDVITRCVKVAERLQHSIKQRARRGLSLL